MRTVRVIVSDMDGTLLQHQEDGSDVIGTRTKRALLQAQRYGIRVILASGRAYPKLMRYAQELQLTHYGGWLVEVNGTAVYDCRHRKRKVFHQLYREQIHTLFDTLVAAGFEVNACLDDAMYYHIPERLLARKQEYIRQHGLPADHPLTAGGFEPVYDHRNGYAHLYPIEEASQLPLTMNKLCICDEKERLDQAQRLLEPYQQQLWWGRTTDRWMEILPLGVSKLSGVRWCCEQMGVDLSDVMAFGDGENDSALLQHCGYGYAMGNALDSVKRIAYDVCDDNKNEGPAGVIERLLEERKEDLYEDHQ